MILPDSSSIYWTALPLEIRREAVARFRSPARQANKIDIHVEVSGLTKPGDDARLRLVLVEESIRYVGGNKLRFHHQVVRALPGGVKGYSRSRT